MLWNRKYAVKSYIKGSLWFVPFVAVIVYWVTGHITHSIGVWLLETGRIDAATSFIGHSVSGAKTLLDAIVTCNLSFMVFTFGSLLVAVQIAGGQYTPRIIAPILLRDQNIRFTVGYFVFTMLFAIRVSARMRDDTVDQFNTFIASWLGLVSVVMFLYLIDYAAKLLRPVSIAARVGAMGIMVIESLKGLGRPCTGTGPRLPGNAAQAHTVAHAGASGVVLAIDMDGLVEEAKKAGGVIEVVPQVGDFVAAGEPLMRLHGFSGGADDAALRGEIALGTERSLDQDPTFALRILVDIAIKALSPAINDPTTAIMAIDQLHRLLRRAGLQQWNRDAFCDDQGNVRVLLRSPHWEDFVHLACTEIRHYGASSMQVVRRMRSMLENLMQTLPARRHGALAEQLALLDRSIAANFPSKEELAMARVPDSQGLGGSLGLDGTGDSPDHGSAA